MTTYIAYVPTDYMGPIPAVPPAVLEPLPRERRMQKKLLRNQEQAARDAEYRQQRMQPKGFMAKTRDFLSHAAYQVETGLDRTGTRLTDQMREWDYDRTTSFFRESFPSLSPSETVWDQGIHCRVISSGVPVYGVAIATTNYLCFDGWLAKSQRLQFAIPLRMVASLRRAATLPVSSLNLAPTVQPVAPALAANAVEIFTQDHKVHTFYSFSTTKSFENFYNIVDHAWRANLAGLSTPLYLNPSARPTPIYPAQPVPLAAAPLASPVVPVVQPGAVYRDVPIQSGSSPYAVPGATVVQTTVTTAEAVSPISPVPRTL